MISESIKKKIETLFLEKKYEEVIKISEESIHIKERPPSLSNLIGICKIFKKDRTEFRRVLWS